MRFPLLIDFCALSAAFLGVTVERCDRLLFKVVVLTALLELMFFDEVSFLTVRRFELELAPIDVSGSMALGLFLTFLFVVRLTGLSTPVEASYRGVKEVLVTILVAYAALLFDVLIVAFGVLFTSRCLMELIYDVSKMCEWSISTVSVFLKSP